MPRGRHFMWHENFKSLNMDKNESDKNRVVTPEPPQVMNPSEPPESAKGSAPRKPAKRERKAEKSRKGK